MEMTEVVIHSKLQSNLNSLIENTLEEEKKWKKEDFDFFFSNNASQPKNRKYETKKNKPCNIIRIKYRKVLTKISYNRVKEEDLWDRYFVFDVYVLTTKNINPFSLARKIFDVKNKEMINMFWEDCNELSFYKHICMADNFLYLKGKNLIYLRVADIVWKYMEQDEQNFVKIRKKLI